jgi:type VI protein secretion system component VasK
MTAFAYEIATLIQTQEMARPGDPEGAYSMPWYLVMGQPGTGRSTAIKAMNMSWPRGDQPVAMQLPDPKCTYWFPEKAVFIEPGKQVVGPNRQQGLLYELCEELQTKRPREPIDGMLLVVSAQFLADSTEEGVEEYANAVRREIVEVVQGLAADVPVYVVLTAYDVLWGFGDAFRWAAHRRDEEPWGFSLPPGTAQNEATKQIAAEMDGLGARIESMCFSKLSSEDDPAERVRAFQHLSEARDLLMKMNVFMKVVAMGNSFERAPWVRALAIGSGIPGTGDRLRHGVQKFSQMGMTAPAQSGTPNPGGMPLHAYIDAVLLPEKDLVPTTTRWRDDKLFLVLLMVGVVTWIGVVIVIIAR